MATFNVYTYLFSPITQKWAGELFASGPAKPLEERYRERHQYLEAFFKGRERFFSIRAAGREYGCMMLARKDGVIVFRIAKSHKHRRELKFKEFEEADEPSCIIIVDNREEGMQTICIQKKTKAFDKPQTVAEILEKALNKYLEPFHLRVDIKAKYTTSEFWRMVDKHPKGIEWVEFRFPYPNMPEISDLVGDIEKVARETNSEPTLKLQGQNKETLRLDPQLGFIVKAIAACAASGRPVVLKPKGASVVHVGTLSQVREEVSDRVFKRLEEKDLFDTDLTQVLEFLKNVKLVYDD